MLMTAITLAQATNVISTTDIAAADGLISQLFKILNSVYGLPAAAMVGISCIVLGYVLRIIQAFPNKAIPVACILWSMVATPLIADPPPAGTVLRVWLVRNILSGAIVGALAWLTHNKLLKQIENNIPILGGILKAADDEATRNGQ